MAIRYEMAETALAWRHKEIGRRLRGSSAQSQQLFLIIKLPAERCRAVNVRSSDMQEESKVGILRKLFGPSKAEVWHHLAREVGGAYVDGGIFGHDKVVVHVGE